MSSPGGGNNMNGGGGGSGRGGGGTGGTTAAAGNRRRRRTKHNKRSASTPNATTTPTDPTTFSYPPPPPQQQQPSSASFSYNRPTPPPPPPPQDFGGADEVVEEKVDERPSYVQHKEDGNKAYTSKDYRAAIGHYTLAIEDAKSELDSLVDDDSCSSKDKQLQQEIIRSLLATYHNNRAAAFTMLLQYDPQALDDCNMSISYDPTYLKAHFRKGKILTTLGRLKEAIKAYSMGLIHDPNNTQGVKEKEEVDMIRKRYDVAKEMVGRFDDEDNNNDMIDSNGDVKKKKKKKMGSAERKKLTRQTLAMIEVVLASCPSFPEAKLLKLDVLSRMEGRVDEAYALSTSLLRQGSQSGGSNNNELLYLRAKCLFYQGQLDDSRKHLRQILSSDPDNKRAFAFVKLLRKLQKLKDDADTSYKQRQFDDAVRLYGEAIDVCPPENLSYLSKLYFNRAACYANLRNHEEVVSDCTKAISYDDGYTKAYMRRAASNLLIGGTRECQDAINDYKKVDTLLVNSADDNDDQIRDVRKKIQNAEVQLKRSKQKDLYKILGVTRDANESEIKKSYRKLALKYHPDRLKNATEKEREEAETKFRDINLANEILSDPEKKRRYDAGVDEQDIDDPNARPRGGGHHHGHGGGGMDGIDPDLLFHMFMQQQHGRRSQGGGSFGGSPFG